MAESENEIPLTASPEENPALQTTIPLCDEVKDGADKKAEVPKETEASSEPPSPTPVTTAVASSANAMPAEVLQEIMSIQQHLLSEVSKSHDLTPSSKQQWGGMISRTLVLVKSATNQGTGLSSGSVQPVPHNYTHTNTGWASGGSHQYHQGSTLPSSSLTPSSIQSVGPPIQGKSTKFSVLSCNVLFEAFYAKYGGNAVDDRMAYSLRVANFSQYYHHQMCNYDVLCFQEFPIFENSWTKLFESPSDKIYTLQSRDVGLMTVYNSSKMELIDRAELVLGSGGKFTLATTFRMKDTNSIVTVLNCHIPWSKALQQRSFTFNSVLNLIKDKSFYQNCIICGDFNINKDTLEREDYPATFHADGWKEVTSDVDVTVVSARGVYEKLDFILMRETTEGGNYFSCLSGPGTAQKTHVYPEDKKDLIWHVKNPNGPKFTNQYFSDHAAIASAFEIGCLQSTTASSLEEKEEKQEIAMLF